VPRLWLCGHRDNIGRHESPPHHHRRRVLERAGEPRRHCQRPRLAVIEIETTEELLALIDEQRDLSAVILNGIDLTDQAHVLMGCRLDGAVFIGCSVPPELLAYASLAGAAVFPSFEDLPYQPYRKVLYSPEDLYAEFEPSRPETYSETLDARVYRHWQQSGGPSGAGMVESLARRIHDHSITSGIEDLIVGRDVVAIMGGHNLRRDSDGYAQVARVARSLCRTGKLLASGGGPGAMEATHLGCWLSDDQDHKLDEALSGLGVTPSFENPGAWLATAFAVRNQFGAHTAATESLGIPTWLYGHEPPNVFATHIAKYFANAIREDGLLTIARHGVIFTPGSAGTVQEVFQDVTQNHYETVGPPSPMVFLGRAFWTDDLPVLALIDAVGASKRWLDEVFVTDDEDEAVAFITTHAR